MFLKISKYPNGYSSKGKKEKSRNYHLSKLVSHVIFSSEKKKSSHDPVHVQTYRTRANKGRSRLVAATLTFQAKNIFYAFFMW